jgi:hypothetical protein
LNKKPCDDSKLIHALAVAPDGGAVYAAAQDKPHCSVTQFAVGGGKMVPKMKVVCADVNDVQRIAVSPDGQSIFVACRRAGFGRVVLKIGVASQKASGAADGLRHRRCRSSCARAQVENTVDELEGSAFLESEATASAGVKRLGKGIVLVRDGQCVWRSVALALSCRRLALEGVKADDAVLRVLHQRAGLAAAAAGDVLAGPIAWRSGKRNSLAVPAPQ